MSSPSRALVPRLALGFAYFAGLAATPAQAHVTITPASAAAGSHIKLTFTVPHGCDGAATTGLHVEIPAGVGSVKPYVHPGWTASVRQNDKARPSQDGKGIDAAQGVHDVAWTGGPLADDEADEFALAVTLPEKAGETLTFPVTQSCEKGNGHFSPTLHLTNK